MCKAPPQVWHGYRMSHSINPAWLDPGVSSGQVLALEDAWDVLVVDEEWREWVQAHLIPARPYLYLAVRQDLASRRLRKTRSGASLQLPSAEVLEADRDGTLVGLFVGVIHDLYVRWATGHGHPLPPELPTSRG